MKTFKNNKKEKSNMNKKLFFSILSLFMLSFSFGALTDSNRLYYTLNSVLTDSSGTGYTLTNLNGTSTSNINCILSTCYDFEASNKRLMRANELPNLNASGFSINLWAYEDNTALYETLFSTYGFGTANYIEIRMDGGAPRVDVATSISGYGAVLTTNYNQQKIMITAVWKNNNISIYINGVYKKSQATSGTLSSASLGNGYEIGARSGGLGFDGRIDEVGYWSREISQTEITQLYNGGLGLAYPFGTPNTFTNVKANDVTLTNLSSYTAPQLRFNVTTNNPTIKKYNLYYYSNGTKITSTNLITPLTASASSYVNFTLPRNNTMYKINFQNASVSTQNYTLIMFGNFGNNVVNNGSSYLSTINNTNYVFTTNINVPISLTNTNNIGSTGSGSSNDSVYLIQQNSIIESYTMPPKNLTAESFNFVATTKYATYCKLYLNDKQIYKDKEMKSSRSLIVSGFGTGLNSFYWYCDLQRNTSIIDLNLYEYDKTDKYEFGKSLVPSTISFKIDSETTYDNLYLVSPCIPYAVFNSHYSKEPQDAVQFVKFEDNIASMTKINGTYSFCLINGVVQYDTELTTTLKYTVNRIEKQTDLGNFMIGYNTNKVLLLTLDNFDLHEVYTPSAWGKTLPAIIVNIILFGIGALCLYVGLRTSNEKIIYIAIVSIILALGYNLSFLFFGVLF